MSAWQRSFAGDSVLLTPSGGAQVGRIRVTPRRPLVRLRDLVAAELAAVRGGEVEGPIAAITNEGEHAALLHVTTPQRARSVGWVFGDAWLAAVESVCRQPGEQQRFRDTVERLTRTLCLGLGSPRWRRFYYDPPPGWVGLPGAHSAVWLSPRCPAAHGVITVFAARPPRTTLASRGLFEDLAEDCVPSNARPVVTRDGLPGVEQLRIVGGPRPIHVTDTVLDDGRYRYPLRLESDAANADEHAAIFAAVVASVRALPGPRAPEVEASHWAE